MNFDIRTIPFSCYGSYMAFSYPQDNSHKYDNHIAIRILYGLFNNQETYPFIMLDEESNEIIASVDATPTELKLVNGNKEIKFCYQNDKVVHLNGNTRFFITKSKMGTFDRVLHHENGTIEIAGNDCSLIINLKHGVLKNESLWSEEGVGCENIKVIIEPDINNKVDLKISISGLSYHLPQDSKYEKDLNLISEKYRVFADAFKTNLVKYKDSMTLAAYINWHSVVSPEGNSKYPIMLMTKNKMNLIWSWDYTFNALAMVDKFPGLAYDQFLAMCEMQDEYGTYPDAFQARASIRTFVKPPVQGFILKKMFAISVPDHSIMLKIYESVKKFTNWWFDFRGSGDGIPVYNHGNDSGWDNSTIFKDGAPVKSPDLCTWLILQMDFLADTAEKLKFVDESIEWRKRSKETLNNMLKYFVLDNKMYSIKVPENKIVESDSLILYIPLLLGDRLPEELRKQMLYDLLKGKKYVTNHGIASEPIDSQYFVEDGYWRGAIWPALVLITTEILSINGKLEEALQNANQFCEMCVKNGFYENYSAIDGHGMRDSGFTWTASAFIILIRDYLEKTDELR